MLDLVRILPLLLIFSVVMKSHQQIRDPKFLAKYNNYSVGCVTESSVNKKDVVSFWVSNRFPSDNQKLKCYFKCMTMMLGVMDATGDIVDDKLKEFEVQFDNSATSKEVVDECGSIKGTDLCETAFKLMVCVREAEID